MYHPSVWGVYRFTAYLLLCPYDKHFLPVFPPCLKIFTRLSTAPSLALGVCDHLPSAFSHHLSLIESNFSLTQVSAVSAAHLQCSAVCLAAVLCSCVACERKLPPISGYTAQERRAGTKSCCSCWKRSSATLQVWRTYTADGGDIDYITVYLSVCLFHPRRR